ncbi:MAG: threonylcarbamoyl-AMP synthase [Syntrophomonadaceae bacterium]|nr:threonylcarbamoyl-AMP synthase [Syntrophomonadaceae bacterium]
MNTVCYRVNASSPEDYIIDEATSLIRRGELVAFPTETVYGLGADALNPEAVKKIFVAKGRMPDNPLIVHVSRKEQVEDLVEDLPSEAQLLMQKFWPGPLTLVARAAPQVPEAVRGGGDSVGVRMPRHPVALALIDRAGPLAAPSANLSGRPSPTTGEHVRQDLWGRIAAILDAGPTGLGIESTVLRVMEKPFRILRPGGVSREELEQLVPGMVEPGAGAAPADKYQHYRTRAELIIIPEKAEVVSLVRDYRAKSKRIGIAIHNPSKYTHIMGKIDRMFVMEADAQAAGRELYTVLRDADREGLDVLLFEPYGDTGAGAAIMDRLRKASQKD